jgi:mannose-6-phosphate isomerase-like protein (cupin superfamily)
MENQITQNFIPNEKCFYDRVNKVSPENTSLDLLSLDSICIQPGATTESISAQNKETLLFSIFGKSSVEVDGKSYLLKHYDTIYIPVGLSFTITNPTDEESLIYACFAPSDVEADVIYRSFEAVKNGKDGNIYQLHRRDVFEMLGAEDKAANFIAGYTIFDTFARSYPAHMHEDQEEFYAFIKGNGAMELYKSEEEKFFVKEVSEGDVITIPKYYYHPVSSSSEQVHFIWVIAGERYWVGNKDDNFMDKATK